MAQQAKKQSRNHGATRPVAAETLKVVRNAEEKAVKMGRDGIKEILREADNINHLARECMGVCTGALTASVESGNAASKAIHEAGNKLMENVNRAFSDNAEIFKEAFTCHTINDITEWHKSAWQKTMDRYFDEACIMCDLLFNGSSKAFEPLQEQTAIASDQLRKAMAK